MLKRKLSAKTPNEKCKALKDIEKSLSNKDASKKFGVVRLLSLSSSFRRAPPKLKKIYYKFTKEKDQITSSHMVSFCNTGG